MTFDHQDTEFAIKCLCCLKPMTVDVRMSSGAVIFDSTGNYGSTKFDCTGCTVRAIVCDACFEERLDCMVGYAERTVRTTKWFTAREAVEETAMDMFADEEARDTLRPSHVALGEEEPLAENFRASGEMSPTEREEQRRSFAYGNAHMSNENVTPEMVDAAAEKIAREE